MQFMAMKEDNSEKLQVVQGSCQPKFSERETMKAITYQGTSITGSKKAVYGDHPKPLLTHEQDAILKVRVSAISGCDLNLYSGEFPTSDKGVILGHEAVATIVEVGSKVQKFKRGDRVVLAFEIACGECRYCSHGQFSECDRTNDSKLWGDMYGGNRGPSAIFGYSRLLGLVPGCQADYVRVPIADVNLYHVPPRVPDEKAIFACDVLATGLHAANMACVREGDTVAIWGLGPIGMFAGKWCKLHGAKRVIGIDHVPERLHLAREKFGFETIDRSGLSAQQLVDRFHDMLPLARSAGGGADAIIEATGFRFTQTLTQKVEKAVGMHTVTCDVMYEIAMCARKCGRIVIAGDYLGFANHFPLGHIMQKHLTVKAGFTPTQKYFKEVMDALESGAIDPTVAITHRLSLQDAPAAYEKLFNLEDGYFKVLLHHSP